MLEHLQLRGRTVAGFGLGGATTLDATSVLSSLGADPSTVYDAYQAQQGYQQMANVFGKVESIEANNNSCLKGCGADQNCMNNCNRGTVLALEGVATAAGTLLNPIVGLAAGAIFSALNQVFGFAGGVADPACPNGPNPWPPSAQDQATIAQATASIFTGTTGPNGVFPGGVTDPFLLSVLLFKAQQSALIENCHWDQALSGTGSIAAQALMLQHWNTLHVGAPETITRTVCATCPGMQNPPDYDQWTWFVTELYFAQNPNGKSGDVASLTINRGGSLNPNAVVQQGSTSTTSTAKKVAVGTAAVAGVGALGIGAYAIYNGISFAKAWADLIDKL